MNKIFFGARIIAALNEESDTNLIDDPFDDFGGTIFVFLGNHKRFDFSAHEMHVVYIRIPETTF